MIIIDDRENLFDFEEVAWVGESQHRCLSESNVSYCEVLFKSGQSRHLYFASEELSSEAIAKVKVQPSEKALRQEDYKKRARLHLKNEVLKSWKSWKDAKMKREQPVQEVRK